jgi:type VI secretion system FHA domain protein
MDPTTHSLTLRVTRLQGSEAGPGLHKVFGARGGTIGRSAQNDWVLPDPTRTLSSHHATVYFEQGRFHLVDCSSNGVYLNDQGQPLGIEQIATLSHGDRLLLGPYELVVELAAAALPGSPKLLSAPAAMAVRASPVLAQPLQDSGPAGWPGFVAPRALAVDLGVGDEVVDPLQLLGPAAAPRPAPPAAQRNDAPVLVTPFQPPAPRIAVPDDWQRAAAPPRAAPAAAETAELFERASAALREALALLESLKTVARDARALATHRTEAVHGLE